MNIPNLLTIMRLCIVPFFGYYMFIENYKLAVVLFLLGGLTDILDGYIARKYNIVTPWGKVADPVADKLMQVTALLILTIQDKVPLFLLIIVIAKELSLIFGGIFLYKKDNFVVSANWYGKAGTVLFYLAIVMVMFNMPFGKQAVIFAVLFALYVFIMYSLDFKRIRNESKTRINE